MSTHQQSAFRAVPSPPLPSPHPSISGYLDPSLPIRARASQRCQQQRPSRFHIYLFNWFIIGLFRSQRYLRRLNYPFHCLFSCLSAARSQPPAMLGAGTLVPPPSLSRHRSLLRGQEMNPVVSCNSFVSRTFTPFFSPSSTSESASQPAGEVWLRSCRAKCGVSVRGEAVRGVSLL